MSETASGDSAPSGQSASCSPNIPRPVRGTGARRAGSVRLTFWASHSGIKVYVTLQGGVHRYSHARTDRVLVAAFRQHLL